MKKRIFRGIVYIAFIAVMIYGFFGDWSLGHDATKHFLSFSSELLKIIPVVFILVGLFEVWVPRETIEKHLGNAKNIRAYIWVLLLAMTTIGGLFVALPIAETLEHKGASKPVVLTYLTGATVVRLPMTIFEATFLGLKFTMIRWSSAIVLTIVTSFILSALSGKDPLFKTGDD